ncbi:hypothetical protein ACT2CI_00020 [Candidatus Vidania fulgoroideorum]
MSYNFLNKLNKYSCTINIVFKKNISKKGFFILPNGIKKPQNFVFLLKNGNITRNIKKHCFIPNNVNNLSKFVRKNKIFFSDLDYYKKYSKSEIFKQIKRKKKKLGYEYGNLSNNIDFIYYILKGKYINYNINSNSYNFIFSGSKNNFNEMKENFKFIIFKFKNFNIKKIFVKNTQSKNYEYKKF